MLKSSDTSVKGFTRPVYSISHKGGKSVLIVKETLCKNNLNFGKDEPDTLKFHYNCNYSFWGKNPLLYQLSYMSLRKNVSLYRIPFTENFSLTQWKSWFFKKINHNEICKNQSNNLLLHVPEKRQGKEMNHISLFITENYDYWSFVE
jgi:hypothetical protein